MFPRRNEDKEGNRNIMNPLKLEINSLSEVNSAIDNGKASLNSNTNLVVPLGRNWSREDNQISFSLKYHD